MKNVATQIRSAMSRREKEIKFAGKMAAVVALTMVYQHAFATDGAEFTDAATKFQGWVQGNLGKVAALVSIAVGSVVAAIRKDWSWFGGALILSIGIGVLVGIVNASFTAVI